MVTGPGEWRPADATRRINACARRRDMTLTKTLHAKARLLERGLIEADMLHVLKFGFVHQPGQAASRAGYWKYQVEGASPNSAGRSLVVVVIPGVSCALKVVTIMWKDEK